MKIQKQYGFAFSATGTTETIVKAAMSNDILWEYTDLASGSPVKEFVQDDFVIVGIPVFGGRVPSAALEHMAGLKGCMTPAVAVVTYGNREYEDALIELKMALETQGFVVIAAAAFIAQHSMAPSIAAGRPHADDLVAVMNFATSAMQKVQSAEDIAQIPDLAVEGNIPFKHYGGAPGKPQADETCIQCGLCAEKCPVGAIDEASPNITNPELCITCMRCVAVCPIGARALDAQIVAAITARLNGICPEPKQPSIFI